MGGYAVANPTTIPTVSPDYPGKTVTDPYGYDVKKAKAALSAAGVAEGTTITALADPTDLNSATLQVLQSQLDSIGLKLNILPSANAVADLKTKVPDIYYSGTGLSYTSQSVFIGVGGSVNYCNFNNADINAALLKTQDPSLNADQRKQAWADYQKTYYQVLPGFNIADIKQATLTTKNVRGVPELVQSQGDPSAYAGISVKK